jgi:large subunit ribosomal protein L25
MHSTEEFSLTASLRDKSIKPAQIRAGGQTPVALYGKNIEPLALSVEALSFKKLFHKAGESSLVALTINNEAPRFVLFKAPQFDPRTNDLVHIDLYQVNLTEKIKAEVPLIFIGEAPALSTHEAILVTNRDKVEVECLPRELPHQIDVDISGLEKIDDAIYVKDLKLPAGVEVSDDPDELVVIVSPHREEVVEEVAMVSEEDAIANVEATAEKTDEETPD